MNLQCILLFQISSYKFSKYLLDRKILLQDQKNRLYKTNKRITDLRLKLGDTDNFCVLYCASKIFVNNFALDN